MNGQRTLSRWIIVAGVILAGGLEQSAQAQFDKRKRGFTPHFIRPNPPAQSQLGVRSAPNACGIQSAGFSPRSATPFGGRSLGFGSLFGGSSFLNRSCNSRPVIISPPTFVNRPSFYSPSNLGHCSSSSFYGPREVHLNSSSFFSPQPSSVFVTTNNYVSNVPNYQFQSSHNGGGDRAISEALYRFKQNKQTEAAQEIPQPVEPQRTTRTQSDLKDIETTLDKGDVLFRKGDYSSAREEYTRALVMAGEDPGVRIPFGLTEFALGRFDDAARAMKQAAAAQPPLDPSTIDLVQAYGNRADFDAQFQALERYLSRKPFDADALFLHGFLKACTGNPIGARAVFEKYLALRDADPAVLPFIQQLQPAN